MWKYVLKRLLWMIAIVIGVAFVIFTILYFTPGDPAALMLGEEASMAERAESGWIIRWPICRACCFFAAEVPEDIFMMTILSGLS